MSFGVEEYIDFRSNSWKVFGSEFGIIRVRVLSFLIIPSISVIYKEVGLTEKRSGLKVTASVFFTELGNPKNVCFWDNLDVFLIC